ncbi:MAG TPA: hypothetical protein VHB21_18925 [Minicystis sp.]|nr:hypothetical protein [Minicystis sp.]
MHEPSSGFESDAVRALESIGASAEAELLDAVMAPREALLALRKLGPEGAVVRAHPPLGSGADGYGPEPAAPVLLRIAPRADGSGAVVVRAAIDGGAAAEITPRAVNVERTRVRCCDAASCALEREIVSVWLELDGGDRLLVAEGRPLSGSPDDGASDVARALAEVIGVDVDGAGASSAVEAEEPLAPVAARDAARYAARTEADRFVLRDHASAGPRATARRNFAIAAAVGVVAIAVWIPAVVLVRGGQTVVGVAIGALAALLTLTAYAFFGVARFSSKYAARSAPLAAFGAGRFVVAPWVARGGAIDLSLEGRLGAAIPSAEVTGVSVEPREGGHAVVLESDHGPIDAVVDAREPVVRWLSAALRRAVELSKHPSTQPSARQRARAKAQQPTKDA